MINQKYKNLEYIVIDGGSKDKTIKIIKKYKKFITKFISEKDEGIYYGFNRGLSLATGDLIGIINSNDIYTKNAFNLLIKYYKNFKNADFSLVQSKNTMVFCMDTNLGKFTLAGVFIVVIALVFLLKNMPQKP